MVPARQQIPAGSIQALVKDAIIWCRNETAAACLARLVGEQIALHHEGIAIGDIPIGSKSPMGPHPMVVRLGSIAHARVAHIEVVAECPVSSIIRYGSAVLHCPESVHLRSSSGTHERPFG